MKIIIFAGGVGTRLWPLSRKNTPKQFEKIIGDKSTLQLAVERVSSVFSPKDIFVSSGKKYKDVLFDQLPQIPKENFILEPEMRDIGAAVGLTTAILDKIASDEPFFIIWSDHLVKNEDLFRKILMTIGSMLKENKNKIVFMGQNSRFASQNLGWIEMGEKIKEIDGLSVYGFKSFHYRPTLENAVKFHESSNHVWNPGYFGTTAGFLFSQYKRFVPQMHALLLKIRDSYGTEKFESTLEEIYPKLEKNSFDNLILEKIDEQAGCVVTADLGWSDVGAWEALKEALSKSVEENVVRGNVILKDSRDSLVFNYGPKMTVGIDLDELLIIDTQDVLLVCPKNSVPKIKKLVESLAGTPHEHLT